MKVITNYEFDVLNRKITFLDYATVELERIVKITNLTTNTVIFNNTAQLGASSIAGNDLYLEFEDTDGMANTDKLQILYEDSAEEDRPYSTYVDEASATVTYIGNALAGTGTDVNAWRIMKIDSTSNPTTILFADGNTNFDNIWDDRASYSYS